MDAVAPFLKLALFAVSLVLILGIWSMARGKETRENVVKGNKLMRLRLAVQAVALALVLIGLYYEYFRH